MTEPFVTRFAPSPTGYLHLGHVYSAARAFGAAKAAGGVCLMRIEDIDRARCRPAYEAAIYEDLAWLGFDWPTPVRRQSEHFEDYAGALARLRDLGVVYRCFKTRKEIAEDIARAPHLAVAGPEGPQYVGAPPPPDEEAARLDAGEAFAWRLSMACARDRLGAGVDDLFFVEEGDGADGAATKAPRQIRARPEMFGDPVIARKDAGTSYHLACVHDDALQGVTDVIRGVDLFAATHLHRLLQALLDLPTPVYRHHRLMTDETGRRFAKRDRSATIRAMRAAGAQRADVLARIGVE